jgi:hypothetical protein
MTNLQRLMVTAGALAMGAGVFGFTPANAQTVVDPRPGTGNPCGTNGTVGAGGTCVTPPVVVPPVVVPPTTPGCTAGSPGCGTVTPVPPVVSPVVSPTINGGSTTSTVTTTVTGTNTGTFDNRDTNNVNASGGAGGQGGSASTGAVTQTQGSIGATGSGNVTTVQGSTSIYNETKPAANSAYAPSAPTVIPGTNRCAVTSSRGGFGLTIVQGSVSAGGRGTSTLDEACSTHDRSLENRADLRATGIDFERNGDIEYSCRIRFTAARANPLTASNPAFSQAREDARCSPPPAPIVEVAPKPMAQFQAVAPLQAAPAAPAPTPEPSVGRVASAVANPVLERTQ